jgi:hypothetical protein
MRSPELPAGSVFKSSACAWTTSAAALSSVMRAATRVALAVPVFTHGEVVHVAGVRAVGVERPCLRASGLK